MEEKKKTRSKAALAFNLFGSYFNILPDKEDELQTIQNIGAGVRFRGANLWILIFAILIASLGLNVNSTAVIIGAMLISPLMGPIIGSGLALGIKDYALLRRSAKNYMVATLISVFTATLYFLITPFEGEQSELLARTSPTLYDVLIAFFGGMAGIVAVCTKGKGNVIPGVAIATALMPPLCTAGYGLASLNWAYFLGAFYLFFINTVFIGLATFLGVKMLRFSPVPVQRSKEYHNIGRYLAVGIFLSLIPAAWMTYRIIKDAFFEESVVRYIKDELDQRGTEILAHYVDKDKQVLEVVAVGREIKPEVIRRACEHMDRYKLSGFQLEVVQGEQSDSVMRLADRLNDVTSNHDKSVEMIKSQSQQIALLNEKIEWGNRFAALSPQLRKEMKILFPAVEKLQLSAADEIWVDSLTAPVKQVLAVAYLRADSTSLTFEPQLLSEWLQSRVNEDSVALITVPMVSPSSK